MSVLSQFNVLRGWADHRIVEIVHFNWIFLLVHFSFYLQIIQHTNCGGTEETLSLCGYLYKEQLTLGKEPK